MNYGRPDQQPYTEDPFGLTDGRDWANSSNFVAPSNITPDGLQMSANTMSRIMAPEGGTLLPEEPAPLNSFGDGNSAPYGTGRSATERMAQLPGSSVARDGATWQQALGIVNPINLVGLPFRFLKMVDRGVKTSLGRRTMADEATDAARYVDFMTGKPKPGMQDGDQTQLPQNFDPKVQAYIRTKAGGQTTSQGMNPLPQLSDSMWNLLTGEGFETERATIDTARQLSIQSRAMAEQAKQARATESYGLWKRKYQLETGQEEEKLQQDRFKTDTQGESFDIWKGGQRANEAQSYASAGASSASAGLSRARAQTENEMREPRAEQGRIRSALMELQRQRADLTMPDESGLTAGQRTSMAARDQARADSAASRDQGRAESTRLRVLQEVQDLFKSGQTDAANQLLQQYGGKVSGGFLGFNKSLDLGDLANPGAGGVPSPPSNPRANRIRSLTTGKTYKRADPNAPIPPGYEAIE